jgi:hypothetical protein
MPIPTGACPKTIRKEQKPATKIIAKITSMPSRAGFNVAWLRGYAQKGDFTRACVSSTAVTASSTTPTTSSQAHAPPKVM